MSSRKIIPLFADTHGGHKLGLLNPATTIWDNSVNPPELVQVGEPNSWQLLMWEIYNWCIGEVEALAGDDEIIPHHVGDITQGARYASHLVSQNPKSQQRIGWWNMKPWMRMDNVKKFRFVSGTPVHIGPEMNMLIGVYEHLQDDFEDVDFKISHHALQDVGKEEIDLAHRGPAADRRVWLEANQLRYYTRNIMIKALNAQKVPPRFVIRAHVHTCLEETVSSFNGTGFWRTTGLILPSFSGVNGYARHVTQSTSSVSNGICCLEVIDGKVVNWHWFVKTNDVRTTEKL